MDSVIINKSDMKSSLPFIVNDTGKIFIDNHIRRTICFNIFKDSIYNSEYKEYLFDTLDNIKLYSRTTNINESLSLSGFEANLSNKSLSGLFENNKIIRRSSLNLRLSKIKEETRSIIYDCSEEYDYLTTKKDINIKSFINYSSNPSQILTSKNKIRKSLKNVPSPTNKIKRSIRKSDTVIDYIKTSNEIDDESSSEIIENTDDDNDSSNIEEDIENIMKTKCEMTCNRINPIDINSSIKGFSDAMKTVFEANETDSLFNGIFTFLKEINLEEYSKSFYNEGFDDIHVIIKQMKQGYGITDNNLQDVGIKKAGDRAKIMIRLQEKANKFDFNIEFDNVYHFNKEKNVDLSDPYIKEFNDWLKEIKMENYLKNFFNSGYYSLYLIYVQMYCFSPFDENILLNDIKIDKIGYRLRIMNKLKNSASLYISKLLNSKNDSNSIQNNCIIF